MSTNAPTGSNRGWVSALLGSLGIVALGILVFAVVSMSHESSHPATQARPSVTATTSIVPVHNTAPAAAPSVQPTTSWSISAVASTMAPPPAPAAPQREPSVRQRLHDMFPKLFPGR